MGSLFTRSAPAVVFACDSWASALIGLERSARRRCENEDPEAECFTLSPSRGSAVANQNRFLHVTQATA